MRILTFILLLLILTLMLTSYSSSELSPDYNNILSRLCASLKYH
jgi:hypothetical protein